MRHFITALITCSVLFIGACSSDSKDVPQPCDEEFIGPVQEGQCD